MTNAQENELNLIILQLQFQEYPKMFNCSCKSKIISEVVNLCIMMFSVLYSYNKSKHGQVLLLCFMNMLLLDSGLHSSDVITVCVTWRLTGRWRKWTWKERHAQEKAILCMFWYFDFSGSSFMEWYEVVKYYISLNSFVSL